jgi:hypothetical protein
MRIASMLLPNPHAPWQPTTSTSSQPAVSTIFPQAVMGTSLPIPSVRTHNRGLGPRAYPPCAGARPASAEAEGPALPLDGGGGAVL